MVLVDYIGIFFTFPNTFDRWWYFWNTGIGGVLVYLHFNHMINFNHMFNNKLSM
jgi:hypothetical protein